MALDLAQWRAFLALAERGSLIKAAEVLYTDQPALSRSLRRMEQLIGSPLFDRSSRGVTLTDLGSRMLQPARDLVDLADAVETRALAEARQVSGVLRIGAVDLYPMTSAIAEAGRDLTVAGRPIAAEIIPLPWLGHHRALLDRTIDIGFTLTVDGRLAEPREIRGKPLWEETAVFALISDQNPLAKADVIDPPDLARLPLHLPDKDAHPDMYGLILEQLADAGLHAPHRAQSLGSMASVMAQIAAGSGWTLCTQTIAANLPPGVVARPITAALRHTLRFEVIWHANTGLDAVEAFITRLQRALGQRA